MIRCKWCVALLVALSPAAAPAARPFETRVVVESGDVAPDGNGSFALAESFFSLFGLDISLNDAGQVAFTGILTDTSGGSSDDVGVFRGDGNGPLVQIAREGQAAPGGNGRISRPNNVQLNNVGQVVFRSSITGAADGDGVGVFLGNGAALLQIARSGQAAPDGNGSLAGIRGPRVNNAGQVAFPASLAETSGGDSDDEGVFLANGTAPLVQIAREGQPSPSVANVGSASFSNLKLNNSGQVAYVEFQPVLRLRDTDFGVVRGDGSGSLTSIARRTPASPDDNGVFNFNVFAMIGGFSPFTRSHALNEAGQVAFDAVLVGPGVSPGDDGLFRGDGASLVPIATRGQAAPDGNGSFRSFTTGSLNDGGQVAFFAGLFDTSGGDSDNVGLFLGDGVDDLVQIVRAGQPAPNGDGNFTTFLSAPLLNNAGQAAFLGEVASANDEGLGVFLYDEQLGLVTVAREGDSFLGSTITDLGFNSFPAASASGLNAHGQVAYRYVLADGRQGVAIATLVPEPATAALLTLGGCLAISQRRRSPLA